MTAAIITAVLSGTFLAAAISTLATAMIERKKFLEQERARVREIYATALESVAAYKELPYAIRRRRDDDPSSERTRLSEEARAIQQQLSNAEAWIRAESAEVGEAFTSLVKQLRLVAGQASHDAWNSPAPSSDGEMNVSPDQVDLRGLASYERIYMEAVATDVARRSTWRALFGRRDSRPN